MISPRYFVIYKPYEMLSQFSKEPASANASADKGNHKTLADISYHFPRDVYPVGRLDADSEGLLFLTNDKQINHRLLDPKFKHTRTYWAQVDGQCTEDARKKLEKGVSIANEGKQYQTLPCKAIIIPSPEENGKLGPRTPPIRFRKNIPTTWIELTLQEGKNRQVRKMTAAVGFPTLRLVRAAIEKLDLGNMKPGEVREIKKEEINFLLNF